MGSSTVCGTWFHQARVPFCIGSLNYLNITPYSLNLLKPSLPTFPQLTLSSLTFSISLSLSQSCYQLTLTFSISLSNSPTRSQSPFQSHSHSHSSSPSRSRSPSPSASSVWNHKVCLAQFEHWVFVGICGIFCEGICYKGFCFVVCCCGNLLLFVVCCLLFVVCCLFLFLFCCGYLDFFPLHQKCTASPIWIVELVILITLGTSL